MKNREFPRLPEYAALKDIPWQLFSTFTFRSEASAYKCGRTMFLAVVRSVAKIQGVPWKNVLFIQRLENGRSGEHWHYHAVFAGLGPLQACLCHVANREWIQRHGGHARVERYDPLRDGVGYILKEPSNYGGSVRIRDDELYIPTLSTSLDRLRRGNAKRDGASRTCS